MQNIIECGKNLVKKAGDTCKKTLLIVSTASLLAGGMNSCKPRTDFYANKDAVTIENSFVNSYQKFYEKNNLDIMRAVLLHDDEEKTVLLIAQQGAKVSFSYKNKDRKDIYFDIANPINMTVSSIENGKTVRDFQKVPPEEAKRVLEEVTGYMK